jgi:hypothetical protein
MDNILSNDEYERIDDIQMEVMSHMDDQTLFNYCRTSKHADQICNSVAVWLPRIQRVPGLSLLLPYRSHYKNLRDFYRNIRNDTQYVLMDLFDKEWTILEVSHDISSIYNVFIEVMRERLDLPDSSSENDVIQAFNLPENQRTLETIAIIVRFNDVVDHNILEDYIIYSSKPDLPNYLNPLILQYPTLVDKDFYVIMGTRDHKIAKYFDRLRKQQNTPYVDKRIITDPTVIVARQAIIPIHMPAPEEEIFINYNIASIRRAHNMKLDIAIYLNVSKYPSSDAHEFAWMRYGYILREYGEGSNSIMLLDFEAIGMKPATYIFVIIDYWVYNRINRPDFFDELKSTPEEHEQSVTEELQDIVMNGNTKLYRFEDINTHVIPSIHEH